jgi:DNA polymerase lambda
LFSSIFGVGPKTALKWYNKGYKTFEDLTEKCELTHQQQMGIKYYSDIQERIPREEVEEIEEKVKEIAHSINKELTITICGSFRRGAKTCGDVDVLIMDPTEEIDTLPNLIDALTKCGLLRDHLSNSKSNSYMGICKIREFNRRIDIKVYPKNQYAFALLYFTGSNYFNRSMRYYAEKKGFSLGDKNLKEVIRVSKQKVHESDGIECSTEEEIFKALGLEYKEPTERNL